LKRLFLGVAVLAVIYGATTSSFAQSASSVPDFDSAFGQNLKTPPKKGTQKDGAHSTKSAKQAPEDADKAARLEEGRKKFFERSMGFDNGPSTNSPITLGGSGGLTPSFGGSF
jgi:hypothetical protein